MSSHSGIDRNTRIKFNGSSLKQQRNVSELLLNFIRVFLSIPEWWHYISEFWAGLSSSFYLVVNPKPNAEVFMSQTWYKQTKAFLIGLISIMVRSWKRLHQFLYFWLYCTWSVCIWPSYLRVCLHEVRLKSQAEQKNPIRSSNHVDFYCLQKSSQSCISIWLTSQSASLKSIRFMQTIKKYLTGMDQKLIFQSWVRFR